MDKINKDLEKAAAEWMASDPVDAFIAGAQWQKEQMLKEAVEGVVHYFGETQGVPRSITIPEMQKWLKPFSNDDKVKLIIVKEDEK